MASNLNIFWASSCGVLQLTSERKNMMRPVQSFHIPIVKPAHVITSFKESTVLKGHLLIVLSQKISYKFILF